MTRLRKWLIYRKYKRRANLLAFVMRSLGWDMAVKFGAARGWIDHTEDKHIHLRATGRFLR